MRRASSSRLRRNLTSVCALAALVLVTACGSSGSASGGKLHIWALEDEAVNAVLEDSIKKFNKSSGVDAELSTYVNDPYKQKIRVSMGSPNAPDIFFNWGGGDLKQYVQAGQVLELTDYLNKHPDFKNAFASSVMDFVKFDGRYYGVPMLGVQPVMLFYNKKVFNKVGVSPPETYADLLSLVDKFKAEGITPIVLPGSQAWTELMWLEYLTARIGGPDVFQAIKAGEEGAWSQPALIKALEQCQELVRRGAFGSDYSAITYDNGSASTLLAQGKAAMFLMGSWEMATQLDRNPQFVKSGNLGFIEFPKMKGGEGNAHAIVGNPSNYFSITKSTDHPKAAKDFLRKTLTSDQYVEGLIEAGQVPTVKGIKDKLRANPRSDYTTFTYELVQQAPHFTQSWDQALTNSSVATAMLTNLQKVFLLEMSPEQFAKAMESVQ